MLALLFAALAAAEVPDASKPLDVREPPFAEVDWSWMNGSNPQPSSLLGLGPVTFSLYADAYYAFQFSQPIDHTIFPATVAARHGELGLNLFWFGVEVTGLDGPIGRLYLQYGSEPETIYGQDPTARRGSFLTQRAFLPVQQAGVGWHFHALHGINLEAGIFPSYMGLESYLPQENWNYTRPFLSDATPYYFAGLRTQIYFARHAKLELWVVNGWQTFGQWHEGRAGGFLLNWRPLQGLSLTTSAYAGRDVEGDPAGMRFYLDNYVQALLLKQESGPLRSLALCLVGDIGYQHRSAAPSAGVAPSGGILAASLAARAGLPGNFALALRGDLFYDESQALAPLLPLASPYARPASGEFLAGGLAATLDFAPSPWVLFRLEYSHRESNQLLFSGAGGITGPGGKPAEDPSTFVPDLKKRDDRIVANATLRL